MAELLSITLIGSLEIEVLWTVDKADLALRVATVLSLVNDELGLDYSFVLGLLVLTGGVVFLVGVLNGMFVVFFRGLWVSAFLFGGFVLGGRPVVGLEFIFGWGGGLVGQIMFILPVKRRRYGDAMGSLIKTHLRYTRV